MSIQEKKIIEVTTRIPIEPHISQEELARAVLSKEDYALCWQEKGVITIKGEKIFSGGRRQWQAILSIAEPKFINEGTIKFEQQPYFHWSKACTLIPKKYGLNSLTTVGPRTKIKAILTVSKKPQENERQITELLTNLTQNIKTIKTLEPTCWITTETICHIKPKSKEA